MKITGELDYKLIVTVVKKGMAKKIIAASKKAGAEGGSVIYGKGIGIHEMKRFWGINVEPEKELILTLINDTLADAVLASIMEAGKLNKPGTGIAFIIDIKQFMGIAHLMKHSTEKGVIN